MYIFTAILAATAVLIAYTAADTNQHSNTEDSQAIGAKVALPTLQADTKQYSPNNIKYFNYPTNSNYRPFPDRKCPLCDSSVYPYCGEKLLHDACCCADPYTHDLPYECRLADCRFLHANNCREHRLIANCCCSDDYRSLLKNFSTP